ncbi:MAG TPA: trypsin-like peptidase domain-containing protein [Acidimicrobiales bacterium]
MSDETEQPGNDAAPEPEVGNPEETSAPVTADSAPIDPPPMPPPIAPPVSPSWPLPPTEPVPAPVAPQPVVDPTEITPAPLYSAAGAGAAAPVGAGSGESTGTAKPAKTSTSRPWVAVALVSALVGAAVGAGISELVNHNDNSNNVTIQEGNAAPGAAILNGDVTIPQLVKKVVPAVVSIDVKAGQEEDEGTGMIITANGEVITNNHVIELYAQNGGTGSITVTQYGQKKSEPATLIGYNAQQDMALLKINNASNLPTVTFGSSAKTQVGDAVVAIGNALGLAAGTPTVTQGIVSALGRSVTAGGEGTTSENLQNLIQTDAAINPGNSGGPLIDTAGQVIGMNTAVAGTADDGTDAQNIGFAIPIASVEQQIPELEKGGAATTGGGYLGVDITTMTAALRQQYGFTPSSGAVVLNVVSGSPAAKAGLTQGDVIVSFDGKTITSAEQLQSAVQKDKAGQSVAVVYYEGDNKHTASITLGSQAEAQQQQSTQNQSGGESPFGG